MEVGLISRMRSKAVDRRAARLFDEEGDRIGLVEQAQPAVLVARARILRVEVDAAAHQDPVDVGDRRGDPAHVEVASARAFVAFDAILDIGAHRLRPVAGVGGVDREFVRIRQGFWPRRSRSGSALVSGSSVAIADARAGREDKGDMRPVDDKPAARCLTPG